MQITNTTVGDPLFLTYRELVATEARLAEALAPRGVRIGTSVTSQWTTIHEYLHLYGKSLSPAGVLVLGGRLDDGSRQTGIPFTGPDDARARLGLTAEGEGSSPAASAFWRSVETALGEMPIETLFGTVHLANAIPFDYPLHPEVREAGAAHVLRLLTDARPQAVLAVGSDALATLARALRHADLLALAQADEQAWTAKWPAGSRLFVYPYAEVPAKKPFRIRVAPVPSLTGRHGAEAQKAIATLLTSVL